MRKKYDKNYNLKNQKNNKSYSPRNLYKSDNIINDNDYNKRSPGRIVKKVFINIFKVVLTLFFVAIITGSIVVTALTVYVMKYIDTDPGIDLRNLRNSHNTTIYATNTEGVSTEIQKLYSSSNRKWVDLTNIPQHVIDAFVYTEDQRFYQHEGVDWKRTFAAFANLFLNFYDTTHGGSTITQQLVKNVTGESQVTIDRKIQEIFKAMNLERHYSKNEILEGYLNIVHMANNTDGIGAASIYYFNKDVSNLTVVEGAALAAMTRSPSHYDPIKNPQNNKERRKYVLGKMNEFNTITQEEYDTYINQDLVINQGGTIKQNDNQGYQSYFIDHVINELIDDLVTEKKYTPESAEKKVYNGGLQIYTTIDPNIQSILEQKFKNYSTFSSYKINNSPQAAMVVMDYKGQILGVVGGKGEKVGNRILNRATQSMRSPGSSIKPLSIYTPAIEKNIITWSTKYNDSPIQIVENGVTKYWPQNYGKKRYGNVTIVESVQRSINTIPVRISQTMTPLSSYNFLRESLGITTLVKDLEQNGKVYSDDTLSGMSIGGLTYGLYLHELTAAYQIYGNKGLYHKPTTYLKVVDAQGEVLIENTSTPIKAISEETAGVMNKLLQQVVEGKYGTAYPYAQLSNTTVIGKTGTSDDDFDQLFIGATPSYIAGIWHGFDTPMAIPSSFYNPATIWKNVMVEVAKNETKKEFIISDKVKKLQYCTISGLIAKATCYNKADGYYKESYIPDECNTH